MVTPTYFGKIRKQVVARLVTAISPDLFTVDVSPVTDTFRGETPTLVRVTTAMTSITPIQLLSGFSFDINGIPVYLAYVSTTEAGERHVDGEMIAHVHAYFTIRIGLATYRRHKAVELLLPVYGKTNKTVKANHGMRVTLRPLYANESARKTGTLMHVSHSQMCRVRWDDANGKSEYVSTQFLEACPAKRRDTDRHA